MGQRKSSYLDVAQQAKGIYEEMPGMRRKIADFRTGYLEPERHKVEAIRQAPRPDLEAARGYHTGILTDPGKAGWSPETIRGMYSASTEAGAGGRNAYMKEMNRQVQASGMGNTGANIRNLNMYDEGFEARNRGSMRDIMIQNELQKRAATEKSAGAMMDLQRIQDAWDMSNLEMQRGYLGMEEGTYGRELQTYQPQLESLTPQMQAYQQAYRPGFWGQLGSSFAQGLGSGLAGLATGGFSGAGTALGQRAAGMLRKRQPGGIYGSTGEYIGE